VTMLYADADYEAESSAVEFEPSNHIASSTSFGVAGSPFLSLVREPSEVERVPLFFLAPLYAKAQLAYHGIAEALDSGGHPIFALERDPELNLEANLQQVRGLCHASA
jgi:hypothetical protein